MSSIGTWKSALMASARIGLANHAFFTEHRLEWAHALVLTQMKT
jgi:hypothetical protein